MIHPKLKLEGLTDDELGSITKRIRSTGMLALDENKLRNEGVKRLCL